MNKNHVISSTATEKTFDKIQPPFNLKTLIGYAFLNPLKVIQENPIPSTRLNRGSWRLTRMSMLITSILHSPGGFSQS